MLEKTLRWSSVSEIQGGIQGGRFEDVEMEIGPVDIYRHISFTNTYLPFPCDTGMVKKVETVLSSDDGIVDINWQSKLKNIEQNDGKISN